jgi:exopolysaccharide production protein ExoZ
MRAHTTLPTPSGLKQIDGLQMLRAFAVIAVTWLHGGQFLAKSSGHRLVNVGVFGVDVFFVISGFILSSVVLRERHQPGVSTAWQFLKRRIIRIYPLYLIFAFFAIARTTLSHQVVGARFLPALLLLPPLEYPGFPLLHRFSWTLDFEIFFYLVLSLVLLTTVRRAVVTLIGILLVFILAGAVSGIRMPVVIVACNPILLEFIFGSAVALLFARFGRRPIAGIVCALLGAALALGTQAAGSHKVANGMQMILLDIGVWARVWTFGIAAALLVGGFIFWSPAAGRVGRVFVAVGSASYSIYLVSGMGIEGVLRVCKAAFGQPTTLRGALVCNSVVLVCIVALGFGVYNLVEWPLLRYLQSKSSRVKPQPARLSSNSATGTVSPS